MTGTKEYDVTDGQWYLSPVIQPETQRVAQLLTEAGEDDVKIGRFLLRQMSSSAQGLMDVRAVLQSLEHDGSIFEDETGTSIYAVKNTRRAGLYGVVVVQKHESDYPNTKVGFYLVPDERRVFELVIDELSTEDDVQYPLVIDTEFALSADKMPGATQKEGEIYEYEQ